MQLTYLYVDFSKSKLELLNISYFFEHIKSVYGDFGTTICTSDDGNVKMAYVKGPEGLLIELVEELK